MDFTLTPEQTSFRDEVRSWLEKNLPKDWDNRMRVGADVARPDVYAFLRTWQREYTSRFETRAAHALFFTAAPSDGARKLDP